MRSLRQAGRHSRAALALALGVTSGLPILIGACNESSEPTGIEARTADPSIGVPQPNRSEPLDIDEEFARIARTTVPGFAGYYIRADSVTVLRLVDSRRRASAQHAVAAMRGRKSLPKAASVVEPAVYDFAQLKGWFDRLAEMVGRNGVHMLDVDERANRIWIGVQNPGTIGRMRQAAALAGVPAGAVAIEVTPPPEQRLTLRDRAPAMSGGYEIINSINPPCTLGFNVRYNGQLSFVTASHCSATIYAQDNSLEYQPGVRLAANQIGTEVKDRSLYICLGKVPISCRWSDATIFRYGSGVSIAFGRIARMQSTCGGQACPLIVVSNAPTIPITRKLPDGEVAVGENLTKVGRTSGHTSGVVTRTCTTIGELRCQYITRIWSQGGDSGSPIFQWNVLPSVFAELHGVLWGGPANDFSTTFHSPLSGIVRDLGAITVCDGAGC